MNPYKVGLIPFLQKIEYDIKDDNLRRFDTVAYLNMFWGNVYKDGLSIEYQGDCLTDLMLKIFTNKNPDSLLNLCRDMETVYSINLRKSIALKPKNTIITKH